ncbi:hypothetical protein DIURU_001372 [Diutina rugosa]|uniref:RNA-polymerase II-associated protein 3-like C-terminal domain-containing protein n=1 Tax=Diutina rugosa TaxID=5481 RepID=A0A642UUI0_DIURU|nr:uncharacterized protein DIURU_001372 [Diutina rugosa]KAA8905710.1 hypothetical protein DIURU_001372 [Diutina rugosa]
MGLKEDGNHAYAAGEYVRAAKLYRDALAADPNNAVLYSNRCQCFLKLKDYNRAYKDAVAGINLIGDHDDKLAAKLYFRKGMALKGLGDVAKARYCFNKVLNYDATNTDAKTQMAQLGASVEVEAVTQLPQEFASMVTNEPTKAKPVTPEPVVSKSAQAEIDALFPSSKSSKKETQQPPKPSSTQTDSPQLNPLQLLTQLRRLSPEEKSRAYRYVVSLTPTDLDMFKSGVDSNFLEFYLEAIANTTDIDPQLVAQCLATLSKFPRYSLSMTMVDPKLRQAVQSKVPGARLD